MYLVPYMQFRIEYDRSALYAKCRGSARNERGATGWSRRAVKTEVAYGDPMCALFKEGAQLGWYSGVPVLLLQ